MMEPDEKDVPLSPAGIETHERIQKGMLPGKCNDKMNDKTERRTPGRLKPQVILAVHVAASAVAG